MYYGNAAATDQSTTTGVWDDGGASYFKGVWHLKETGTNPQVFDSTSNGNNSTAQTWTPTTSGQVDGAGSFNGGSNYISGTNASSLSFERTNPFTISSWINTSNTADDDFIYAKEQNSGNYAGYYYLVTNNAGAGECGGAGAGCGIISALLQNSSHYIQVQGSTKTNDGRWHNIIMTYSGSSSASGVQIYVDGKVETMTTISDNLGTNSIINSVPFTIGSRDSGGVLFKGSIDETRVSSIARSADWIKTEYNNQNSPSTFYSSASEESVTVPAAPTSLILTPNNGQVTLTWTAPVNTGGLALTDYVIDYRPTGSVTWSTYADGVSTTTSFTVIGLINGTSYDFRVSAVNALGQGSASATSVATPATTPDAPIAVIAVAGNARATVTFTGPSSAAKWYNGSWVYRSKITIDHTKVGSTTGSVLQYFPVLVSTTTNALKYTGYSGGHTGKSNGGDILFTLSDGTTKLNHEVELYASSTGQLVSWIKVPSISTSTDTVLYMYYGNAGAADQGTTTGVWDDGGSNYFKGVWHLPNGTTLTANDSTINALNGTLPATSPTSIPGQVDGAGNFNGSSSYIDIPSSSAFNNQSFTISVWIRPDSTQSQAIVAPIDLDHQGMEGWVLQSEDATTNKYYYLGYGAGSTYQPAGQLGAGKGIQLTYGSWQYISYTKTGTSIIGYRNGTVAWAPGAASNATVNYLANRHIRFGSAVYYESRNYKGDIDEVRISSTARSADWISTEYNNQNSPNTFYAIATEETAAGTASNGGSAITSYTVTSSPGSIASSSNGSPIVVTGLTNGTAYTFTVTATNAIGTSPASAATSPAAMPAAPPDAPTAVSASAGNAQIGLTWSAPAYNGGAAITDYVIEYKLHTDSVWSVFADGVSTATTTIVTGVGLVNGSSYDFRISAANSAGQGSASTPTVSSTPYTTPDAPITVVATRGNARATVTFTGPSSVAKWYNSSWTYRKKITIDKTKVPNTNQTNFPVLVSLAGLSNVNASGTDIRFTSADGVTELAREIEYYSSGSLVSWVKVPLLSTTVNTDIYMYYGNSSAVTEPVANSTYGSQKVWDDGGSNYFKGVWHLGESSGTVYDSTSNHSDLIAVGSPTYGASGNFGKAITFGSSAYLWRDAAVLSGTPVTISAWARHTGATTGVIAAVSNKTTAENYIQAYMTSSHVVGTDVASDVSHYASANATGNASLNTWTYVVDVQSAVNSRTAYRDGENSQTNTTSISPSLNITLVGIQKTGSTLNYSFSGDIDEVRISSIARSADWIKTEYNNQYSTSTFYQVAGEEVMASTTSNGGSAITSYTVTSSPGSIASSSTGSPIVVTGLSNGTAYTFTVTATNAAGTGPASTASNTVTPATTPDAPTVLTATAGRGQVGLTWTAPAVNGGSAITDYVIQYKLSSELVTWSTFADPVSTLTSGTVIGLTNASAYDFRVYAVNDVGPGTASVQTSAMPVTVPDAPTIGTATPGNAQASVTFTPPVFDGGSAVNSYTVKSTPGNFTGVGAGSPIIVAGLTNGTSYTFTVTATNAVGEGASSTASNAVIPVTVPNAPTGVIATPGNRQASITFTLPTSDGGTPITNYTVTSDPGGYASTSNALPIIVTGLTNGTAYTFTVTATNAVGTSSASAPSNSVTLSTEPGAPVNLAAVVLGSSISLSWAAPASNGGSTISDYIIEYQLTTGGTWSVFSDAVSTQTTATIIGLSNGTSYDFRVRAVNIIGQSIPSGTVSATPGEPAQVLIQSFSDLTTPSIGTAVRITNEGLSQYEYQYTYCVTDSDTNLCGSGDGADIFSSTAAKLVASHENWDFVATSTVPAPGNYWFHIRVNYGSQSSRADQSFTAVATFPDAPTDVTATSSAGGQASVSFGPPLVNGGSAITSYTVTSSPGGIASSSGSSPILVTGLTNGTAYTFTVTATNAIGTSPASSPPSNSVTPVSVPDAPTGVTAVAGNTQVTLSWTAPLIDGGTPIIDYVIDYKLSSEPMVWTAFADGISVGTTVTITGLTNNLSYDFRVSAVNVVGQSAVQSTSATLPANAPVTPPSSGGSYSSSGSYVRQVQQGGTLLGSATTTSTSPAVSQGRPAQPAANQVSATPTEHTVVVSPIVPSSTSKSNTPASQPVSPIIVLNDGIGWAGVLWLVGKVVGGIIITGLLIGGVYVLILRRRNRIKDIEYRSNLPPRVPPRPRI